MKLAKFGTKARNGKDPEDGDQDISNGNIFHYMCRKVLTQFQNIFPRKYRENLNCPRFGIHILSIARRL
jgi:hypothetical protein